MQSQVETLTAKRNSDQIPQMPEIQDASQIVDDLEPKRLELASVLQKTLEPKELIALFARELGKYIPFDGLSYDFPTLGISIRLGELSKNKCSYDLKITDEHLGDISLHRESGFQERELANTESMLAGLLYPLRNTLLYQQALQSATTDPLTGVKNRAAMESSMKRELGLAHRHGHSLSMILLDLDHFKAVNDQYGHLIGDQVLRAVATVAEETIRDSDMIFRFGGEEFLVLLHSTQLSGAALLAERMRRRIEELEIFPDLDMRITASMGVVTMHEDESAETIFMRVDNAMYRAKNNGRNRVVVDEST
jgi:diguanylate cyclase (GGDEF)-like protein